MTTTNQAPLNSTAQGEILALLSAVHEPDVYWIIGDNFCDCLFQRIGEWKNPYLGRTLRVRLCCIWAEIYRQYPQFVQELPYHDANRGTYTDKPAPWDSEEMDMPLAYWHRQLAIQQGKPLAQIREEYRGRAHERPKKVRHHKEDYPTPQELAHGKELELRAAGWIL